VTGRLFSPDLLRRLLTIEPAERMRSIRQSAAIAEPQISNWFNDSKRLVKFGLGFRALGSLCEVFRPHRGKLSLLAGRPTGFVFIVLRGQTESNALLLRYDSRQPFARGVWFDSSTLGRLNNPLPHQPLELFAAREFAAKYCAAPVDGIVELDSSGRSSFHVGLAVIRRLIGNVRFDQIDQFHEAGARPRSLRSSIAARDLGLVWWSLTTMPRNAISVIDYPNNEEAVSVVSRHLGHGSDTTSKWQAGPREKRAM